MSWMLWVVVGWLAFSALVNIAAVGKEQKATTPGGAMWTTVLVSVLIALTILGGGLL